MHICMDWNTVRFDWNRARAFLVTAEEGSLSAAARALGLAQPTLSRQVDALERELGVVLFERVGRRMQLTPSGFELIDHVRAMGQAASAMSIAAFGQNESIEGTVTISVSEVYAGMLFPALLEKLHAQEPRITVQIIATSDTSDLLRREADLAVRSYRPTEPDLIARKLRSAQARLYASDTFAARFGPIDTAADLNRAPFIGLGGSTRLMQALNSLGLSLTPANFPFSCENYLVMWALVKHGLGIGILDDRLGDAEPGVRRILPDFPAFPFDVWLVAHREVHNSRRLRLVFDFLAKELR